MTKRLNIRVDEDMHAALSLMADVNDTSVQQQVETILADAVAAARKDKKFQDAARERLDRQREAFGL